MKNINRFLFLLVLYFTLTYSFWFGLAFFYLLFNELRFFYIGRLKKIRDNADFTTVYGKALIKGCNYRIDLLNGLFWKMKLK